MQQDELEFNESDILLITEPMDEDGFYKAQHTVTKRTGLTPCNFIELYRAAPAAAPSVPAAAAPVATSITIRDESDKKKASKNDKDKDKDGKQKKSTFAKLFGKK